MNNNYISLINRFWIHSIERAFNTSDCMLYFYLLNTCNTLHWKQPFGQSDRYLSFVLGISVPTIRQAKLRLKQRGLIDFKAPEKASKAYEGQTQYSFPKTNNEHRQYKKQQKYDRNTETINRKGNEARQRKAEIVRRAIQAITESD